MIKPHINNTYCDFPFKQLAMKDWRNSQLSEYTPCCMMMNHGKNMMDWDENVHLLNPNDAFNHEKMNALRNDLLSNVRNKSCEYCWDLERKSIKSPRLYSNENDIFEFNLRQIDISISNKCNLMCRMCNYGNSHKFLKEINYFKKYNMLDDVIEATGNYFVEDSQWRNPNFSNAQLNWLLNNTDKIKLLKVSGGEPFYDQNIISILKKYVELDNAKNTTLIFNTNGTLFNDDILKLNSKFKKIDHYISVDGVEDVYDYIRYPFTFEKFLHSISKYKKLKNIVALRFACVVNALNIFNMDKWLEYFNFISENLEHYFIFTKVRPYNRGISLNSLSKELLLESKNKILKSKYFRNEFHTLIDIIDEAIFNNMEDKRKMLKEVTLFDKSRNQNFEEYLDYEIIDWLKNE